MGVKVKSVVKEVVYIFISHSHHDVDKVRPIRNYLESLGAEPILFFLKSKTDADEIEQLIKDEIDARVWFIYCKSSNAESSTWVKKEREYVKLKGKRNITIDIDSCIDSDGSLTFEAKQELNKIVGNFRSLQKLYISYSHLDFEIARMIQNQLSVYGIDSYFDIKMTNGHNFENMIIDTIRQSKFYVILLSKRSIDSLWVEKEFEVARKANKVIIPVIMYDGLTQPNMIMDKDWVYSNFRSIDCFMFDASNSEKINESVNKLVNLLVKITFEQE